MRTSINRILLLIPVLLPVATNALGAAYSAVHTFGTITNVSAFNPKAPPVQDLDGTLYGTTFEGEGDVRGTVFKIQPDGTGFTILKHLTNYDEGWNPAGGLTLSGNTLYGTARYGGAAGSGTVFKLNTDGTGFTTLHSFDGAGGSTPLSSLLLSNGVLFGTTVSGGSQGYGTVFRLNTDGASFTNLHDFDNSQGANPSAGLVMSGTVLYGASTSGGNGGSGTVFSLNTDGSAFAVLHHFAGSDGADPEGTLATDGDVLYGTTYQGGDNGNGTIFALNTAGTGFTNLHHFSNFSAHDGSGPLSLILSGTQLCGTTLSGGSNGSGTVFTMETSGSGFATLHGFGLSDGSASRGVTLSGNTLYGTTSSGGSEGGNGSGGYGTIFKVNTSGSGFVTLYDFSYRYGYRPYGALVVESNTLYGTTSLGGVADHGTVFAVESDGTGFRNLYNFTARGGYPNYPNADGAFPQGGLALAGGSLFGTANVGGLFGNGSVFKVNTDGSGFTNLHNFSAIDAGSFYTNADGATPLAGLAISGGNIYGATSVGGVAYNGTIFKMNTNGSGFATLHNFSATSGYPATNLDGASPRGTLLVSGTLVYGTTINGGKGGVGTVFRVKTDGTGFTNLHTFSSPSDISTNTDGANPAAGLTLSGDTLFGVASHGGFYGNGTVFKMKTDGSGFSNIYNFEPYTFDPSIGTSTNAVGAVPNATLVISGDHLYGSTAIAGAAGGGTVFSVTTNGTDPAAVYSLGTDGYSSDGPALTLNGNMLIGTRTTGSVYNEGELFALSLFAVPVPLVIESANGTVILSWTNAAFSLQASHDVIGIYTNVTGAISPYTNTMDSSNAFFRLQAN